MRRVRVEAEKKRAYVELGALQGRKLIEPLLGFGTPHGEHIGVQPYAQWQIKLLILCLRLARELLEIP